MHPNESLPVIEVPVACTLGESDLPVRLADWRRVLAHVEAVERSQPGAVVMRLSPAAPLGELTLLCEQEVACCPFFEFALHIASSGVSLTIRVPVDAAASLTSLVSLLPPSVQTGAG